jgi:NDP-sugar pyrophosphorylase family protein
VIYTTELLVLAGGFGTRLRPAVSEVPKPLAPVGGTPYLHFLLDSWVDQGIKNFTFLLHHQADLIEAFLNLENINGKLKNCKVQILTEPQPLGTGGAVAYAVQQLKLSSSLLVANSDTWLGSSIEKVLESSVPAMAVVHVENTERYGRVSVDQCKIVAFEEKQNSSGRGWINAGFYHLHSHFFTGWRGLPFSLECELFPRLVRSRQMNAVLLETDFIDIGIPEDYFRFCRWIESGKEGRL